ncbi:hypothetical protein PTKIN_Ptkin06aG0025000 [Pterospermum kingtungense]
MLEEVCLRYDLPKALTWANVNEIMYKKHTLFFQSTFCYPYCGLPLGKDEHEQMQFIAGKALQSSEHFHFEDNFPLLGNKYAAVAICLENYYKIDDVYVVEFLLPKIEKELQEPKSLALGIFNDLKNMKKKFVTIRSQLKGLNEQEEVIPNFHTPKHPLQLLLNDEQISSHQSRVGDCSACGEKVSAPSFSCVECGFYIHQKCAEAPFEIFHPFHLDHPLLLQKMPYYYYDDGCSCDFCDKSCKRFFYHCSCGLDFHVKCALFTYDIAEKKLKELEHVALKDPLILPENNGEELQKLAKCFACWEPLAKYAYFSPDCGFNLHKKCADLPLKINAMGHEHPLALQFYNELRLCVISHKQIHRAGFKYCCSPCNYFVHIDCVLLLLLPPNVEVKNHQRPLRLLNEQEEVIQNFHTPLSMSLPVLHEQGSGEQTSLQIVQKDVKNLPKKQSNKRRKSSSVWDEFTEKQDGVGNIRAICAHCKKDFDGSSKKGTTHLRNHLERCKLRAAKIRDQQLTFPVGKGDSKNESVPEGPSSFDPAKVGDSTTRDTNERNSMFDQDRSRLDFARMIIKHQYPLDMAGQEYFRTFLKNLQPDFEFQSREIILSDIDRLYAEEKEKLHRYFDQLACSFSLTISSCKENLGKNVYCCLIAQFIDDEWKLRKKILAFKSVEHMYDTGTLVGIIGSSISEWNMGSKVCSITVDDSSLTDDIVQQIKEYSSHCFISCSTLIRDGFREIDYILLKLKKSIEYVSETAHGKLKFQAAVNQAKQQGGKSMDDLSLRLDPEFGILDSALKSREIFCQLEKIDGNFRVNPSIEEWDKAQALHGFLEGFHDILRSSKGTQSLTSNLYFPKLCDIYKKFLQVEKSNYPFVALMKGKFDHYWSLCNLVLAVAAVLDPRLKFTIVKFSYHEIYCHESEVHLNRFRKFLTDVYYEYANKPRNLTTSASAFGEFTCSTRQSSHIADVGQPMFPDNAVPRNEVLAREATIWTEKDVRAYLVSLFTVKDFEHLRKWQDLAISGENVGPDKIQGKALAPLLRIPPSHVDWEDARSYFIEDTVVNQFFVLLERRYKRFPHKYLKHYSFDSSTASFLVNRSKSESEVLSWVKQEELKGVRKVFLPMCLHEHWLLFYADVDDKKLVWLDSNRHSRMSNLSEKHVIHRWFSQFLLPSMRHDQKDWSFDVPNDIPLQKKYWEESSYVSGTNDIMDLCPNFGYEDLVKLVNNIINAHGRNYNVMIRSIMRKNGGNTYGLLITSDREFNRLLSISRDEDLVVYVSVENDNQPNFPSQVGLSPPVAFSFGVLNPCPTQAMF